MKFIIPFLSALLILSCGSTNVGDQEMIFAVEYVKYRDIDRDLFEKRHSESSREMREFNWNNLTNKMYYTLLINGKESLYKRNLTLKDNQSFSDRSGTVTTTVHQSTLYYNTDKDFTLTYIDGNDFILKDAVRRFNWNTNYQEERLILGYKTKKATSQGLDENSSLTVWYAPELPANHGPYLFNSLPGLILEVEEKFDFSADDETSIIEIEASHTVAKSIDYIDKHEFKRIETKDRKVKSRAEWLKEIELQNQKLREYHSQGVDTND